MMTAFEKWKAKQPAIQRLFEEIERLEERFSGNRDAIEALECVKFWAIEETVPPASAPCDW